MSLNTTPSSERIHISFFGKRNAGKSSLVNAVTGQDVSVVSDIKGTTTDPVFKSMELLPAGPVMIIDTPGFDDEGALGELRIKKTKQILEKTDVAVLVTETGCDETDNVLIKLFREHNIPFIITFSKSDISASESENPLPEKSINVSAHTGHNINELKNLIAELSNKSENRKRILGDFIKKDDTIVLVIPVDEAAPKGRIILPQQMVIREILDAGAIAVCAQPENLSTVLSSSVNSPVLVITDSQAFREVSETVPDEITLTSFSILMANYKGILNQAVSGLQALNSLSENDVILISEGCTHHRQCGDIGSVKLPALIKKHCGVTPKYEFSSGSGFPEDISKYKLIIHCGGCMLNEREVRRRAALAEEAGIPFTNYGTAISYMTGILKRTLKIFPETYSLI